MLSPRVKVSDEKVEGRLGGRESIAGEQWETREGKG